MFRNLRLSFVLALLAAPLWAGPVTSGNVVQLAGAPASLRNGHLESNMNAFLFRESSIASTGSYSADMGGFGAGAAVNSWYVHFDPIGSNSIVDPDGMFISFTFETEILGIDYMSDSLSAGDAMFGNDLTEYRTGDLLRGTEPDHEDVIRIGNDGRTVMFDFKTWYENADEFRVFTAGGVQGDTPPPNPEPGTIVLLSAAIASAAYWRRRRDHAGR